MQKGLNKDWALWIALKDQIAALEYQLCDRTEILTQFCAWGELEKLSVYYWNPGYRSLQQVSYSNGKCTLQATEVAAGNDILQTLSESSNVGIYLLEGILDFDIAQGQLSSKLSHQLTNAFYRGIENQYWVLLDSYIELPVELQPLISVFSKPLPTRLEVQNIVFDFCSRSGLSADDGLRSSLVRACLGLPTGEINLILNRSVKSTKNLDELVQLVLQHKMGKLRGRGLDYISEPDVEGAAGLDLLNQEISKLKALLDPTALQHGLQFPKGWCLWGPPGTGKSLSAKLTASSLGLPLIA
ncbi:MAG: AAA family ATPase, partial [Crinalium sp.]